MGYKIIFGVKENHCIPHVSKNINRKNKKMSNNIVPSRIILEYNAEGKRRKS